MTEALERAEEPTERSVGLAEYNTAALRVIAYALMALAERYAPKEWAVIIRREAELASSIAKTGE
jgi:hypothetical protein